MILNQDRGPIDATAGARPCSKGIFTAGRRALRSGVLIAACMGLISAAVAAGPAAPKVRICFLNVRATYISEFERNTAADHLRELFHRLEPFVMMERSAVVQKISLVGMEKLTACEEPACFTTLGKSLLVDGFVYAEIRRDSGIATVQLVYVSAHTGRATFTAVQTTTGTSMAVLNAALASASTVLAGKLLESITPRPEPLPQAPAPAPAPVPQAPIPKPQPVKAAGDLYIETSDTGAAVEIDGVKMAGTTPVTLRGIAAGRHEIVARKGGMAGSLLVNLEPDGLLKVNVPMVRGKGRLKVFTEPPGVKVSIDGTERGPTPFLLDDVDASEKIIRIAAPGFRSTERKVTVEPNKTVDITITLEPVAYLTVEPMPTNARVALNGKDIGVGAVQRMEMPPGVVSVRTYAEGYVQQEDWFEISPGEEKVWKPRLQGTTGRLNIRSDPRGASIVLDGKVLGVTPLMGVVTGAGGHGIRIEMKTYNPYVDSTHVHADSTVTIHVTLNHPKAFLDSIAQVRENRNRIIRGPVRRIMAGTGLLFAVAGGGFHYYERKKIADQRAIQTAYDNATSDFDSYVAPFEVTRDAAKRYEVLRNVSCVIAGAAAIAFSITFAF